MIETFKGGLAVVTGAGNGIAREVAKSLSDLGMTLALMDVDEQGLAETLGLLSNPENAHMFVVDVRNQDVVTSTASTINREIGVPMVLINCAGRLGPFSQHIWEYANDEWTDVFDVNLFGPINCVRAFLPAMRAQGVASHVVNLASTAGIYATPRGGVYAASKHALVSFTETLAMELEAEGSLVGVSLVCPGAVVTNFNLAVRQMAGNVETSGPEWKSPDVVARHVVGALKHGGLYVFTHENTRTHLEAYQQKVNASLLA